MSNNPETSLIKAPYGHACAPCAQTKMKCVLRVGTATCERCHRTGKTCVPGAGRRRNGGRVRKSPSVPKTSQLEHKLDDLVSLLRSQNSMIASTSNGVEKHVSPQPYDSERSPPTSPHFLPGHYAGVWVPKDKEGVGASSRAPNSSSGAPSPRSVFAQLRIVDASNGQANHHNVHAEQEFEIFRTRHLTTYPLMHIPPDTSLEEFRKERPFLWMNIEAIFSSSLRRDTERGQRIREWIAHRVVVEGERSIELLLGTLMHGAWAHLFSHSKKPFGGILSTIARTLVADLKLDTTGPERPMPVRAFTPPCAQHTPWKLPSRNYEEDRALLACFITSAEMSVLLRYECLRWGARMEHCAQQLFEHPECPEDPVLVSIARISRISSDAAKVVRRADEGTSSMLSHIMPLKASLDNLKSTFSVALLTNETVLSYLYHAETMVYEIALYEKPSAPIDHAFTFRRPEYLYSCVEASKRVVDTFLSLDTAKHTACSMYENLHVMHAIQTLHRLSLLDEPGWDRLAVRKMADVISYLQQLVTKFELAQTHASKELGASDSIWARAAQRLTAALPKWSAGLDNSTPVFPLENSGLDSTLLDFTDDAWYTEFFSDFA